MKFLTNLDLNKNQLLNAQLQNLAVDPSAPVVGQMYFNTSSKRAFIYTGTVWAGMDAVDAVLTGGEIVIAINGSGSIIDDNNLSVAVNNAISESHNHGNKAILDAITASFTTAMLSKLNGIDSGAEVNSVNSVSGKTGAVTLTKNDVGLSSVTNDPQVKKLGSSTSGNVPTFAGATGDALTNGYGVETTLVGSSSKLARADAIKNYVDGLLSANDAMVYKGTIGSGGTVTSLPTSYSAGWTYKVITAGTYAGETCEIGDMLIAINTKSSGGVDADWNVIQTNTDGTVVGPASSTSGNFPIFTGTSGKVIANSSYKPSSFAAAIHSHPYTEKVTASLGASTSQVVTHNLNSRDLTVLIRETASPYAQILTDVEFTTVNTLTVKFTTAPAAGQYTIVIIG